MPFLFALGVILGLVWLWDPLEFLTNEITSYPALCFPNLADCNLTPLKSRTSYKIDAAHGEVHYRDLDSAGAAVQKLTNCAIWSRTDWSCNDPTDGSAKVQFIDGIKALNKAESMFGPFFYLRRWQWWTIK